MFLPQVKNIFASSTNLVGRVWKNTRAARAACSYEQVRAVLCKTTT